MKHNNKILTDDEETIHLEDCSSSKELGKALGAYEPRLMNEFLASLNAGEIEKFQVERPYVDKEVKSSSGLLEMKNPVKPFCMRVHIWGKDKGYKGFFMATPYKTIGRTYIDIGITKIRGHIATAPYKVNLLGDSLEVRAFPWMEQAETCCAYVAIWQIIHYYSQKYPAYAQLTLGELTRRIQKKLKKNPKRGLDPLDLEWCLEKNGFKMQRYYGHDEGMKEVLYTYMESGIPFMAKPKDKPHCVTIIGHSAIDYAKTRRSVDPKVMTNTWDFVKKFISNDDNNAPYCEIGRDEIELAFIPLPESCCAEPKEILLLLSIMERKHLISPPLIRRVFMASSNSFKQFIAKHADSSESYKICTIERLMPKFIWMADYFNAEDYPGEAVHRILIDSTSSKVSPDNIISIKLKGKLIHYGQTTKSVTLERDREPAYIKNLQERA